MERNAASDVRVWAKSQGFQVGDRGPLPAAVIEAFKAAGEVDAAPSVGARTRKSPSVGNTVAATPAGASLKSSSPRRGGRAPRDAGDQPKRPTSAAKQPSLLSMVSRVAELEAQVAALTERLDAVIVGGKQSRRLSLPRLR